MAVAIAHGLPYLQALTAELVIPVLGSCRRQDSRNGDNLFSAAVAAALHTAERHSAHLVAVAFAHWLPWRMSKKSGRGGCFYCRWGQADVVGDKGLLCTHPKAILRPRWDACRDDEALCGAAGRWWEPAGELPLETR